ncbi:hypothetical protein K1T71_010713 [Dendrolimus kikuchii]|uniref:Uncharacterized protein n=1 Tax=Dendrolimus kikuchii TaxID=765133 RepID=A0ACC1CPK7_9NEOP|nr:hypothetical protein K1T71_010713 [Dendrolimus kikuchii]
MGLLYLIIFFVLITYTHCIIRIKSLNSEYTDWTVENKNKSISLPGSVPGGIYSDLQRAGVIGDILYRFNDVLTRWVAYDTWTYTGRFNVTPNELNTRIASLVFDGVDTIAFVELNDHPIGSTNNMFVRYVYDVKQYLKIGQNELKIYFASPIEVAKSRSEKNFIAPDCVPAVYHGECHANQLRKMQASFAWDWGPAFPSVGLWKPVYLEFYNSAIIRSVTTHTVKKDGHWYLKITAHLESGQNRNQVQGFLSVAITVEGPQKITVGRNLDVNTRDDGKIEAEIEMTLSENVIREWWPNGYGDQNLYDLHVFLSNKIYKAVSVKHIQVGFRTIEVIETNATTVLGNSTGAEGLTFFFKINGYPLFMKGSNWIPAHILPELGTDRKAADDLLNYARDGGMSMLRVWGGGVYESDYFYERCDQLGILIWQDFLFACAMYPVDAEFLKSVQTEVEQNVIRLQHHTSIALWAGNNENEVALRGNWYGTQPKFYKYKADYIKLYVDTIKPIVNSLDPGRRYVVSSPSNGIESETEGYIARNPYDSRYGDTHYYNYLADSWDPNIYPTTRFASEYGFQSLPSIITMKTASNETEDFKMDSEFFRHRQHSPNGYYYIRKQINKRLKLSKNDTNYFEKFVFYSQISQAMAIKTETEFYRQSQADWYTMGALYWQLNDVWQAPSWSSIEYGTGKWKILHYFARSFFAPVLVSPRLLLSGDVDVYLINDRFVPIVEAQIIVDVYNWSSLTAIDTKSYQAEVGPLSSKRQNINIQVWDNRHKSEIFWRFTLKAEGVPSSPFNYVFPIPLKSIKGLKKPNIQITVSKLQNRDNNNNLVFNVDVKVDAIVLFLWLDTTLTGGYFEENGFVVTQPYLRVKYISKINITSKTLYDTTTYQYYLH